MQTYLCQIASNHLFQSGESTDHKCYTENAMSQEQNPSAESSFTPLELPTLNPSDAEPVEPRLLPIDSEHGKEALLHARSGIENFETFAANLALGPQTRTAYNQLLASVASRPDGIQLFAENQHGVGRLIHESLFHKIDVNADSTNAPDKFLIELTPSRIEGQFTDEIIELTKTLGLEIDRETALQLAYAHLMGHELSHGIQEAYSYSMPSTENMLFPTPLYQRLPNNSLEKGIVDEVPVPAIPRLSAIIESERFAEGIAQEFVVSEMVRLGVIRPDDSQRIESAHNILTGQRRHDRFNAMQQIISEVPEGDYRQFNTKLDEAELSINLVGYGMPHDMKTIERILAITP
jgi:hypothetical protein